MYKSKFYQLFCWYHDFKIGQEMLQKMKFEVKLEFMSMSFPLFSGKLSPFFPKKFDCQASLFFQRMCEKFLQAWMQMWHLLSALETTALYCCWFLKACSNKADIYLVRKCRVLSKHSVLILCENTGKKVCCLIEFRFVKVEMRERILKVKANT